jgi:hypothetical protein
MKKRFVILFSVFVVFLILFVTFSSAIQYKTDKPIDAPELDELEKIINLENCPKHPILFILVRTILYFRMFRAMILFLLSTEYHDDGWQPYFEIIHPLLFFRCTMLDMTCELWYEFWSYVSDFYGWDWYF